jgi:hypothetical protein
MDASLIIRQKPFEGEPVPLLLASIAW